MIKKNPLVNVEINTFKMMLKNITSDVFGGCIFLNENGRKKLIKKLIKKNNSFSNIVIKYFIILYCNRQIQL